MIHTLEKQNKTKQSQLKAVIDKLTSEKSHKMYERQFIKWQNLSHCLLVITLIK